MRFNFVFIGIVFLLLLAGCSNDENTQTNNGVNDLLADPDFMFNTTITVELQLQSTNQGEVQPNAYFEIFDNYPKDGGVRLLSSRTDDGGSFLFNLQVASYKGSLILYNENKDFFELEIVHLDDLNGSVNYTFNSPYNSSTREAPAWEFNTSPYYATIFANVMEANEGVYSDDVNDMFASFIGNTCVSVTGGSYPGAVLLPSGRVLFTHYVYFPNDDHHNVNFRFYDASEDKVYAFDYWYYIQNQDIYGSNQDPEVFYYDGNINMPDPYILSMAFPGTDVYGTLAFEDKWPQQGDYDINDFVLYGNFEMYLTDFEENAGYFEISYKVAAIGAAYQIGFGIQFQEYLELSGIESSTGLAYIEDDDHTVIFCENAKDILPGAGFINTDPSLPYTEPEIHTVTVDFEENWDYRMMIVPWEEPPFNTFIFVHGDRTHEIHPADYPPTELVNDELWGDDDDTSDPDEWRYYRTPNNLPWVFMVPIELPYPTERSSILDAYPFFDDWVESPWEYNDWYMDEPGYRNYNYIYTPPGE